MLLGTLPYIEIGLLVESFGSIRVEQLDWGNEDHIKAVGPPFDYIIGTDVVYSEHLLEPLLKTIMALSGSKTTIMLGYEIRSTSVHEQMLQIWKRNFEVKMVPKAKMDDKYQHPSIQLFTMVLKSPAGCLGNISENDKKTDELQAKKRMQDKGESIAEEPRILSEGEDVGCQMKEDSILRKLREGKLSDWETRRYGAIAARLLRDVKIT